MRDIQQLIQALCVQAKERMLLKIRALYAKINKKGNTSFFLLSMKGAVALIFVVGIVSGVYEKDFNSIISVYSAGDEEVQVDSMDMHERATSVFVSSRFSSVAPTEEDGSDQGVGGSIDPTLPTLQGSVLLGFNPVEIPEAPAKNRKEATEYVVKPGDTATGIASNFGISLNTLLWSNHFNSPNYIKPGEKLIILPFDGVLHEVKSGDTISGIASAYKSDGAKILEANEIDSAENIFIGQTILIPGGIKPTPTAAPRARSSAPRYASQPNLNSYFIRPTGGRISQGLHLNNAVDIANSCWTPIVAAASGTVSVASSGGYGSFSNGGYGGFIIVNHPNGTRTLYAHLIKVEAYAGQQVGQGQVIGRMGGKPGTFGAGRSTGCHLHWEVHGARNPMW